MITSYRSGKALRDCLLCLTLLFFVWSTGAAQAGASVEEPTLRDTNYAIPDGAYFVSVSGSDSNEGSVEMPFRTLTRAVQIVPPNGTIVIREGVYRESVPYVSKPLRIQPYPHEHVWLKGSLRVDDWIKSGSLWRKDNWSYRFDNNSYEAGAIDPVNLYAGHPDMVFIDGRPLAQVGALADVGPENFYVDYESAKLYIGADPTGKSVEASAYSRALRFGADGVVVRGIGFMHYAGSRLEGMVQFDSSDDVTIENNTFAWAASRGLAMYNGNGAIVRGNTFVNNGKTGFAAWRYDNVRVEGNRFAGNNQEQFKLHGTFAEPAGAKITVAKNWVVRDNTFENNKATGLWLDISNYNFNIVSNRVIDNLSYGIYYEISGSAIIGSNLVVGNSSGIRVSNSSDVKIYNNTLVANTENISIQDDSRTNSNPDDLAMGITYVTADIALQNNILSDGDSTQNPFVWVRDYNSSPLKSADQMISVCDTNAYHRLDSRVPANLISWWSGANESTFRNLADFQTATGHETNGLLIDDSPENPFFVAEDAGDYRLKSDSIAVGAGARLPVDVADAIGVEAGVPVDLGALILDWSTSAAPSVRIPLPPTDLQLLH